METIKKLALAVRNNWMDVSVPQEKLFCRHCCAAVSLRSGDTPRHFDWCVVLIALKVMEPDHA